MARLFFFINSFSLCSLQWLTVQVYTLQIYAFPRLIRRRIANRRDGFQLLLLTVAVVIHRDHEKIKMAMYEGCQSRGTDVGKSGSSRVHWGGTHAEGSEGKRD